MTRRRKPPCDWSLEIGRVYRDRNDPNQLVRVESEPHPRSPKLVSACDSDDGGERWFSGLRPWRPIQDDYEPTVHLSAEAAWAARRERQR